MYRPLSTPGLAEPSKGRREAGPATYVGEVGDAAADEQHLALGPDRGSQHEVQHGPGVVVRLRLRRRARVFAVVGQLVGEAGRGDGVGVHDRGAAAGHERPDAAVRVEHRQLERRAGLGVQLGDVGLLLAELTAKGSGEVDGRAGVDGDAAVVRLGAGQAQRRRAAGDGPLDAALELGRLVELRGQVQEVHLGRGALGVGNDDQRVDLEVPGSVRRAPPHPPAIAPVNRAGGSRAATYVNWQST